ncbi:btk-binding protein-related [Anaeramoeba flamelloides]|uniref:Btk-binding protein-related n=1 Tax=Anaeramoeba flamelloides TaxID=1746091 RepID=A0AAV7ZA89_9EUKA|nr:btk-binding protein-related [Anaeramoeba flamelloides]
MPVYVQDKVTKIFAGSAMNYFFITSQPDHLYACGTNVYGELGVDSTDNKIKPAVVKNFKGSEILTVSSGIDHSVLVTKKVQTFSCGDDRSNGDDELKFIFTLIPQLKEKKAVQLATRSNQTLVLTDKNELYIWGIDEHLFPTNEYKEVSIPTKVSLPTFFTNYLDTKDMIRIDSGTCLSFLYLDFNNTLSQDLGMLFESKKFCDCEIGTLGNKIPVHKELLECRTKLTIDQIQKKLFGQQSSIDKEQTLSFLKWDIAQLYKDDDPKDFKILVKIDDDDDDDEENENEDEDKETLAHKFLLLARSGLFREMFDNVNEKENTNKVQDYSNKTIESLQILIKYFYTNSIELTADEDPELIVDELSDAVEYYQLNDQCNFASELSKIKKQFDLN